MKTAKYLAMFAIAASLASCSTQEDEPKTDSNKRYSTLTSTINVGEIHNASLEMFYDKLDIANGYDSVLINDVEFKSSTFMNFLSVNYGLDTTGGYELARQIFSFETEQDIIDFQDSIESAVVSSTQLNDASVSVDNLFITMDQTEDSTNTIFKLDSIYNIHAPNLSGSELDIFTYKVDVAKHSYLYWSANLNNWHNNLYPSYPLARWSWKKFFGKLAACVLADAAGAYYGAKAVVSIPGLGFVSVPVAATIVGTCGSVAAGLGYGK